MDEEEERRERMRSDFEKPVLGEVMCLVFERERGRREEVMDCEVVKVGRKYFTVVVVKGMNLGWERVFVIDTRKEKRRDGYSSDLRLWGSREEYDLDVECRRWKSLFYRVFSSYSGMSSDFKVEELRGAGEALGLSLKKEGE